MKHSIFNRIFKYTIVGLLIGLSIVIIDPLSVLENYEHPNNNIYIYIIIYSIIITSIIWEGCLRIDNFTPNKWSWRDNLIQLSLWNLFYCFILSVPVIIILMYHLSFILKIEFNFFHNYIYWGIFMSFIISIINISSKIEQEFLEAKTKEQYYINAQKHLAPHFLFNSLSVLNSLISVDRKLASDFTNHLSDVYRYILQYKDKKLICIEDELKLLKSYIFVAKTRFGKNVIFDIALQEKLNEYLPPLSMQLLVENAIKHNIINNENKLYIEIYKKDKHIYIKSKGLKKNSNATEKGTGLKNLQERFLYIIDKKIRITEGIGYFCVKIPIVIK